MSEDDVRRYLTGKQSAKTQTPRVKVVAPPHPRRKAPAGYQNFSAIQMLCPTCRRATPVRERLMLVLPDGDLFEYRCSVCATSVGTRRAGK